MLLPWSGAAAAGRKGCVFLIYLKLLYGLSQHCSQSRKVGAAFPGAGNECFISLTTLWDHCFPLRAWWSSEKMWERWQRESTRSEHIFLAQPGSSASCCTCTHCEASWGTCIPQVAWMISPILWRASVMMGKIDYQILSSLCASCDIYTFFGGGGQFAL